MINHSDPFHLVTAYSTDKSARKFCISFNALFGEGLRVEKKIGRGALAETEYQVILDKKLFKENCEVGNLPQFDAFLINYIFILTEAATFRANHKRLKRIVKRSR